MITAATNARLDALIDQSQLRLLRLALDLGAVCCGGPLSELEQAHVDAASSLPATSADEVTRTIAAIQAGSDPLGVAFRNLRSTAERRATGVFYTPPELVKPMVDWILQFDPSRVVDAGCGSGRFTGSIARRKRNLPIVAIDLDPIQTILTRATLRALGVGSARVTQTDYTIVDLPRIAGRTAFVGNPPYVRHHDLSPRTKAWAARAAQQLGLRLSALAGLHVYFYLATALMARPDDVGCFVTSAEWLDVNYGSTLRRLFLGRLGGQAIDLIDPRAMPFSDAMTTAVIASFQVGAPAPRIHLRTVAEISELESLGRGREVNSSVLHRADRWMSLLAGRDSEGPNKAMTLGAVARVHRGLVTGANDFFVLSRERAAGLGILAWCRPAITSAEEILSSEGIVRDGPDRRVLFGAPAEIDRSAYPQLDAYLRRGEEANGDEPPIATRYVPSHRRPWWFLGRHQAPPIIASYMARQAPRFALNPDGLAIINVLHGIYPKQTSNRAQLEALVTALNQARDSFRGSGRTYHGGLEKFEPREMEALQLPDGAWS